MDELADKKVIFVAFPIEEERARDFLKAQSLNTRSPFEYIDMSIKEAYETGWKEKVRARIKRSHGVIAFISKHSIASTGQKWEIQCAHQEGVPITGIWIRAEDKTVVPGIRVVPWTWPNIATFIDSL
jgi:hypothetical protein